MSTNASRCYEHEHLYVITEHSDFCASVIANGGRISSSKLYCAMLLVPGMLLAEPPQLMESISIFLHLCFTKPPYFHCSVVNNQGVGL